MQRPVMVLHASPACLRLQHTANRRRIKIAAAFNRDKMPRTKNHGKARNMMRTKYAFTL